jgi:hypothetical protein
MQNKQTSISNKNESANAMIQRDSVSSVKIRNIPLEMGK